MTVGEKTYRYISLQAAEQAGCGPMARLPRSTKILLENVLRHNGDHAALPDAAYALTSAHSYETEIPLYPTRVLMPDSSGLPLIADLAAMRDAAVTVGTDPRRINPIVPVDLVLDHSLVVDLAGRANAAQRNLDLEIARNVERYKLVRWAEKTLNGLRVIPPGNGICHQINLERLARVVWTVPDGDSEIACCDTLIGTDSHTPMVNSLCVLGWGVGGIEAATAMLGEPIEIRAPEVIGCRLIGRLSEGVSTTDLALTVT
ncbi:MAG: aconitate hydratase, partial [Pseudorhodoplanes sp.]|nr:aconitate hydratase [Pseudorhodoplanes sp.]